MAVCEMAMKRCAFVYTALSTQQMQLYIKSSGFPCATMAVMPCDAMHAVKQTHSHVACCVVAMATCNCQATTALCEPHESWPFECSDSIQAESSMRIAYMSTQPELAEQNHTHLIIASSLCSLHTISQKSE